MPAPQTARIMEGQEVTPTCVSWCRAGACIGQHWAAPSSAPRLYPALAQRPPLCGPRPAVTSPPTPSPPSTQPFGRGKGWARELVSPERWTLSCVFRDAISSSSRQPPPRCPPTTLRQFGAARRTDAGAAIAASTCAISEVTSATSGVNSPRVSARSPAAPLGRRCTPRVHATTPAATSSRLRGSMRATFSRPMLRFPECGSMSRIFMRPLQS